MVGRPSADWTESGDVTLEKHVPPPVPVGTRGRRGPYGLDSRDAGGAGGEGRPRADPDARHAQLAALAANPELTSQRAAIGAATSNVIELRWGWHDRQRRLDPHAREFRVYVAPPLNRVTGENPRRHPARAGHLLARRPADAPGRAPRGGRDVRARPVSVLRPVAQADSDRFDVEARAEDAPPPAPGPVTLSLRRAPGMTRPSAWRERVEVQPITAATTYRALIVDELTLRPNDPKDTIWVGVSSADAQRYVLDSRASDPAPRPGNESAVVPVACQGRYTERPVLADIPLIADVTSIVMSRSPPAGSRPRDRSDGRPRPHAADRRPARPARACRAPRVMSTYRLDDGGNLIARVVDREPSEPWQVPAALLATLHPADRTAIANGVAGRAPLEDRHLCYLAAAHPYADRLFSPAAAAGPLGPTAVQLPGNAERWVYRVRAADAAGNLSEGAAVARSWFACRRSRRRLRRRRRRCASTLVE